MAPYFFDREDAGRQLGERLRGTVPADVVVLALPRGGVPVGAEVADALGAPLDVILVRKLGFPSQPEVAMGAIGENGVRVLDEALVQRAGVSPRQVELVEHREQETLERRAALYRAGRPRLDLKGKTVVIVDDGIATGATATAACRVARRLGAEHVIVAVPIASPSAVLRVHGADRVVCIVEPADFRAVGEAYTEFAQVPDSEVVATLGADREASS